MNVLLKNAKIVDNASPFYLQTKDILIEEGKITKIEDSIINKDAKEVSSPELCVSQSWIDLKADFRDPGFEDDEDIQSGLDAAADGGFGHVFIVPSTSPVIDSKGQVNYVKVQGANHITSIYPMGAITKGTQGESMAEMYDMYQSGVRLFTDNMEFVSAGILMRALLYVENFGGTVISFPQDESISLHGQVNEGDASLRTGLKSIPALAEEIRVQRDLSILEYTEGTLHFTGISTLKSLDLIRQAKKKGLSVTCDVHVHQLLFNETAVLGFDTNHKVMPPYRTEEDRQALWEGLKDGTIDCIVSNHQPYIIDKKDIEFDNAEFGNITLQTFFASLNEKFPGEQATFIEKMTIQPRELLNFEGNTSIDVGNLADLTIFDSTIEWTFDETTNLSKSFNSPFFRKNMKGKAIGIIKKDRIVLNTEDN